MRSGPDDLAIVSTFVLGGLEPLRLVIHHDDGTWSFLCNTTGHPDHLVTVHTREAFERFATDLATLHPLPQGHLAERQEPGDDWVIEPHVEG